MRIPPIETCGEYAKAKCLDALDTLCDRCDDQVHCANCVLNSIRNDILGEEEEEK